MHMTVVHTHAHEHPHITVLRSLLALYVLGIMTRTEPISRGSPIPMPKHMESQNLPTLQPTPGVHAGAGAAALYHRRAHAVHDAQVLWRGNYISHSLMHFVITSVSPSIH